MTVMKWMSCIVPYSNSWDEHGQAIVQIQVQPQSSAVYSRRPGDDSIFSAALRNGDSDAGAD